MTSWKTTVAGVVPIVGAVAGLIGMATGSVPVDAQTMLTDFSLIGAGFVGLLAKDHNVSNSPNPAPAATVGGTK